MSARKATELVPTMLRIRESLRKKLERAAKTNARSVNQEITNRIERTFAEEEQWEAHAKDMEERREEIEKEERVWYEEQARERALHEAALRDSQVLQALIGGDENARVLRLMVLGLGNNPDWAATPESRKTLADKVHHFLVSVDLRKGEKQ
jgi:hypothetical protein